MTVVLVRYNDNWADEMDIRGHTTYPKKAWEGIKDMIRNRLEFPFEIYVGSNQDIRYDSANELLNCFSEQDITEADHKTLIKLKMASSGEFPEVMDFIDLTDEEFDAFDELWADD